MVMDKINFSAPCLFGIEGICADELKRMGAKVSVEGRIAVVDGVDTLKAAPVKATDLRAGAAMIIAALSAQGTTYIEDIQYIERGYEDVVEKLTALGADIKVVYTDDSVINHTA